MKNKDMKEKWGKVKDKINEMKYPVGLGILYVVVRYLLGLPVIDTPASSRKVNIVPDFCIAPNAPKTALQEAIRATEANALTAAYDSTMLDHCKSIYELLENVTLVDDETKAFAVKSINTIMTRMTYDSTKKSALRYMNQIVEL